MIPFPGGWRDEWLTPEGDKITIGRQQEKILREEYPSLFKDSKDDIMTTPNFPAAGVPHPDQVQFTGWVSDGIGQWIQGATAAQVVQQVNPLATAPAMDPFTGQSVVAQNPMTQQQPVGQQGFQPQQQYTQQQYTQQQSVAEIPEEPKEEKDYDGILGNLQDAKGALGISDETINAAFKKGPVWAVLALGFFWGIFADSVNFNSKITGLLGDGDDTPAVVTEDMVPSTVTEPTAEVSTTTPEAVTTTTPEAVTTITSAPPGEEPIEQELTPPG